MSHEVVLWAIIGLNCFIIVFLIGTIRLRRQTDQLLKQAERTNAETQKRLQANAETLKRLQGTRR